MTTRHFLSLLDLGSDELVSLIDRALELKRQPREAHADLLQNRVQAILFEKSSTRTRVSFEAAMLHCGGGSIFLSPRDCQLGRGESIADTARVISRMADVIVIRTFGHDRLTEFARHSGVPVINALTDSFHPCQLLADVLTYQEHRGAIRGRTVTWVGDGNNMCQSYINAARQFDFRLRIACPPGYEPDAGLVRSNADRVQIIADVDAAVEGAHLVVTDVWASMGQEEEQAARRAAFADYQVSPARMDRADADALFMHCLPAHRGEEISEDMLEDPRSVVWDEAENRLHAQKALLERLILGC